MPIGTVFANPVTYIHCHYQTKYSRDKLANSEIFSTLDLQCGYWQMPVDPQGHHKTAFCPGPGMGLFHFRCMPFGLTGAPSSFQRLMNQLLRDLPFVTVYLDEILVHSANKHQQESRKMKHIGGGHNLVS